ncbi:MAG TPA: hypothetical protein DDY27_05965 [Hyphomonadaceae bacterium]|nr:hypothetical protein [Hyphomonadaceae bacterium]
MKTRGQTIPEITSASQFLIVERPIDINSKARKKLKPQALEILGDLRNALNDEETWTSDQLETLIQQFCDTRELSLGQVGPQLRTALTGGLPAPDLHLILSWLGKAESIGRIDDVLKLMNTNI